MSILFVTLLSSTESKFSAPLSSTIASTTSALFRDDQSSKTEERNMEGLFVPTGAVEKKTEKKSVVMDAALLYVFFFLNFSLIWCWFVWNLESHRFNVQ
jgi:hypothetical protein